MSFKVSSLLDRLFLVFSKPYRDAEFIKICLRFGGAIGSYQVDWLKNQPRPVAKYSPGRRHTIYCPYVQHLRCK